VRRQVATACIGQRDPQAGAVDRRIGQRKLALAPGVCTNTGTLMRVSSSTWMPASASPPGSCCQLDAVGALALHRRGQRAHAQPRL